MQLVIIGGVAGGASAAARARRIDESAQIILLERGPDPSFANCGLPYYIGGQIADRQKLLVTSQEQLRRRHRIDVRTRSEAVRIMRDRKVVLVRDLEAGREYELPYDKLILSPGGTPLRPPLPGIDTPHIHTLRDLRDADRLHSLVTSQIRSAVVVGGGFIGIEMAENLIHRGLQVTLVELSPQILPPWDQEMTTPLRQVLRQRHVQLQLGTSAESFSQRDGQTIVHLKNGQELPTDLVILCIGVRPENQLAIDAGLNCGARGGIATNGQMQTSDPDIYAVGDAAEVRDFVTGEPTQIPLAGPANRQGRIAADHALGRQQVAYRGTQGTSIVGLFERAAALTGQSEKGLRRANRPYAKVYIHPADHATYYPGSTRMTLKLLFDPSSGKILGAQAVGQAGVDKRIDVLAVAIQAGWTVFDLEQAELCYAPQFGSAKDPINMAGFVAAGHMRGDHPLVHVEDLPAATVAGAQVVDVRTPTEHAAGTIPGAINIPVDELRERMTELATDREVIVFCQVGQRGYLATRILLQHGRAVRNLSGGFTTWRLHHDE